MRNRHAARRDEVGRSLESREANVRAKVISKVGAIGQVKYLENQRYVGTFFDLEIFRNARVELEVRLSTNVVEGGLQTICGANAVSILHCIGGDGWISKRVQSAAQIVGR